MGEIKDIADLTIKLLEMNEAKKFSTEILKIQSLAASIGSQQAEMLERDLRLIEENSELRRKLEEASAEEVEIHETVEFRKGKRTAGRWLPFCPNWHKPAGPANNYHTRAYCSAECGWMSPVIDLRALVKSFNESHPT